MSDLIDRQAAIDALGERPHLWTDCDYELGCANQYDLDKLAIETVPSVQPVRHGKWIPYKAYLSKFKDSWSDEVRCSRCRYAFGEPEWKYCPECGARMDAERKEE